MSRNNTNLGPEPQRDANGQPTLFRPGSADLLQARGDADSMTRGNSRPRPGRSPRGHAVPPYVAGGQARPPHRVQATAGPHSSVRPASASSSSSLAPSVSSPSVSAVAAAWGSVAQQRPPPPENQRPHPPTPPFPAAVPTLMISTPAVPQTIPPPAAPIQEPYSGPPVKPMLPEVEAAQRMIRAGMKDLLQMKHKKQEEAETVRKQAEQEAELARKRKEEQEILARQEKARQERAAEEKRIATEKERAALALKKKQDEEAAELARKQTEAKKEQEAASAREQKERRIAMQKEKAAEDARQKQEEAEQRAVAQQLQANQAADTQTLRDALMRTSDEYATRARADSPMQSMAVESTIQLSGATARIHMAPLTPVSPGSPVSSLPPRPTTYDEARKQRKRLIQARAKVDDDIAVAEARLQDLNVQRTQLDEALDIAQADMDRLDTEE